jgi:hypothetical protein
VTGNLGVVTKDNVATNDAIMGNVAVSHDHTIFANLGLPPVLGTPVNGYKLTNGSIITDLSPGILTLKFEVLGHRRNNCSRENAAILADPGAFHNGYITPNPGTFAYFHILVNN